MPGFAARSTLATAEAPHWGIVMRPALYALLVGLAIMAVVGTLFAAPQVQDALTVSTDPISSFYWLVAVILIYLTSAADSAWDLLIEVGRQRRRRTG